MSRAGRRPRSLLAGALACAAAGCNAVPTAVALPPLDVVVASGDGQFGILGEVLDAPLRVVVVTAVAGIPREGVSVVWEVTQGAASVLGVPTTVSDSTGSTEVRLRLGQTAGEVRVRASAAGQSSAEATFRAFAVDRPTLAGLSSHTAAAGDTITVVGSSFSTVADQNVVLFSGFRGRVIAAAPSELRVEVPRCLPARPVHVRVQIGSVPGTDSLPMTVTGGTRTTLLPPGGVLDVADDAGFACVALAGGSGAEYLVLVYSASAVGAARHPFTLRMMSSAPPLPAPLPVDAGPLPEALEPGFDPQAAWDQGLRQSEADHLSSLWIGASTRREATPGLGGGAAAPPAVGQRRVFRVLNRSGSFDQVSAVARFVGSRAAIFVDETAPPPPDGFTNAQLESLSDRFDRMIHPEVTSAFGAVSDIDGNQRVIILFTPAVNRLTPRGSSGFIGGFFYGIDLLPSVSGSNGGELFYALVPDPQGLFSDPHSTADVLASVPAVLAHEFQHMVHFNERILVRGATSQEALWLSEGLAQMAEERVARAYAALGDAASRDLFRAGVRERARRYLRGTDTVSVVVTAGQGSLAERGAGFLHVLYLEDRLGAGILGSLTRTTRSGVANVETETGIAWPALVADWWSAIWLDGPGTESGPLVFPSVDLRAFTSPFPLSPVPVGAGDHTASGLLWSSSVRYHLVSPPASGSTAVRLGGAAAGPSSSQARLRVRIVRVS